MKIRSDFVTNSSSSSFLLAFKNKEDGILKITELINEYDSDYIGQLLKDFVEAVPISKSNLYENIIDDVRMVESYAVYRRWSDNHPNEDYFAYHETAEGKMEIECEINRKISEIIDSIGDREYLVVLPNVEDVLEYYILPDQNFTVQRFSHH